MPKKLIMLGLGFIILTLALPMYYHYGEWFMNFNVFGIFQALACYLPLLNISILQEYPMTIISAITYTITIIFSIAIFSIKLLNKEANTLKNEVKTVKTFKLVILIAGSIYILIRVMMNFNDLKIGFVSFCIGMLILIASYFIRDEDKKIN